MKDGAMGRRDDGATASGWDAGGGTVVGWIRGFLVAVAGCSAVCIQW